jgi:RNA polymerase sigma-70 factor (ECF subfamily)
MASTPDSLVRLAGLAKAMPASEAARRRAEEEVVGLFDEFRGPLLRYLSSFLLESADSEEVVQEAFLALFKHLNGGKPRENLRGWLFRVAHNLALKKRYRNRRARGSAGVAEMEDFVDSSPSPEEQLATSQAQQNLLTLIHNLPEVDRQCIFLRAEGLRYREIAEILGISLGSVSNSLARSLARLTGAAKR